MSCSTPTGHRKSFRSRLATTTRNRQVYAAVFIDAIVVKVRDGQAANRPIYAAIGVSLAGEKDVLGQAQRPSLITSVRKHAIHPR